uniref:Uncharacterized protein n=1 Tax=Trichogramma kaykai TaxID=54128 RepID=A0ABD2XA62_9HYME
MKDDENKFHLVTWLFEIIIEHDRTLQIDTQDRFGNTLLHLAFDSHHENLAKLLLRRDANPNLTNKDGETPLHNICSRDYDVFDAAKMLFDISDEKQKTIFVDAQDKRGWTTLHSAVDRIHVRLIRLLLKRDANPNITNAKGETPLYRIFNRFDDDVFVHDLYDDFFDLAALLLRHGADPNIANASGETPLHKICELCENESIEVVNMCMTPFQEVKQRVQADVRDKKGNAPLHIALGRGYKNLIEWLLKIGADPNCINKDGETALHIIIDRHTGPLYDKEFVAEFFKIVDDEQLTLQIDVKNNSGQTPLQCAVANLLPEVVGVLGSWL